MAGEEKRGRKVGMKHAQAGRRCEAEDTLAGARWAALLVLRHMASVVMRMESARLQGGVGW
jgi:hypothetical protein